jgi:uncharacterized OsmC-like protein
MASLRYLFAEHRRARRRPLAGSAMPAPRQVSARVRAEGCSGLRHIQIRDFQLLTDLGPDCAGFDLGPTPFELQLGALGSCLTQHFLLNAAARGVAIERIEVEVTGQIDPFAGEPNQSPRSPAPHDIRYTLRVTSSAPAGQIACLRDAAERSCPIFNLLVQPQPVRGTIVHELGTASDGALAPN